MTYQTSIMLTCVCIISSAFASGVLIDKHPWYAALAYFWAIIYVFQMRDIFIEVAAAAIEKGLKLQIKTKGSDK